MVAHFLNPLLNLPDAPGAPASGLNRFRARSNCLCGFYRRLLLRPAHSQFPQLVWNIFLMCIGQHPLQNPHSIKPEIGKLSKTAVDSIPLVLYIPAPEDQEPAPIPKPSLAHTYPPTPPKPKQPKRRFFFLRKKRDGESGSGGKGKAHGNSGSGDDWEDNWEKGEYPFVRLEGNRAACAICLMDFDEPKRVGADVVKENKDEGTETKNANGEVSQQPEGLRLEDAGEGPQPLRLLACGHVFHVSENFTFPIASNVHPVPPENVSRPLADGCFWAVSSLPKTCRD